MAATVHPLSTGRFFGTEVALNLWCNGKQIWLRPTPKGAYIRTNPQGEGHHTFTLLTFAEALRLYQMDLPDVTKVVPFEEGSPGYEMEEG